MAADSCDVLVVGAGPTGLMLADWLVRLGVRVVVADGKPGPTRESRALVVQARSLEIYRQLGLADEVLPAAQRAVALAPGFGARVFGRIPLGPIGAGHTPYPYIEVLEQSRNEEILYAALRKQGGDVRWQTPVTTLEETPDGVRARLADGDTVTARFCVGADGANSVVRRSRDIPFDGVTNPHRFYVIDATAAAGLVANAINVRLGADEFLIAFPMAGRGNWRLIGVARRADDDGEIGEEDARARMRDAFAVTYDQARWYATYNVHHRVARRFRDGPFFLAGDAGHVHSPVGGQGMNTGLQDAHNLAFKLADVLHDRASDVWLDRYEAERRPVAQTLVATTDRLFGLVTSQRFGRPAVRRALVPLVAPLVVRALPGTGAGSRFFQYVSQTRIHYRMGADAWHRSEDRRGRPGRSGGRRDAVVGRRLPWADDNYDVLSMDGIAGPGWQVHAYGGVDAGDLPDLGLPVHVFPEAAGSRLRAGELYLVRPDGFVAARAWPGQAADVFARVRREQLGR
ncbi:FAD-dependent monooxygenase [Mangrovihabitans endophyticus]|uniref:2-polyprenyl-6-methoxyphenol hydroxylase n=1 Tax=Mangrovihabitans endophyticus TaxID=1751298 RepID=A0A8J3FR18_9ACTN|nr:FAD-dependent monooxygenase [Mangrovihabitans endophyticus]GGL02609.1 2-polyprenyl-6-methoxyphenol hydroxylase [Mangrovihabitans endophyticus]